MTFCFDEFPVIGKGHAEHGDLIVGSDLTVCSIVESDLTVGTGSKGADEQIGVVGIHNKLQNIVGIGGLDRQRLHDV